MSVQKLKWLDRPESFPIMGGTLARVSTTWSSGKIEVNYYYNGVYSIDWIDLSNFKAIEWGGELREKLKSYQVYWTHFLNSEPQFKIDKEFKSKFGKINYQ